MNKVLIVEDNLSFRALLKGILSERFPSMSIVEATNADEAFMEMDSFSPDVILMDIHLPGENGLQLTEKIRARSSNGVIIILTSDDMPEFQKAAQQCGADYFFSKNTTRLEEIVNLVESLVPSSGQPQMA